MPDEANLNLVQKLAKIREMVEVLRKNKSGFNYKYVTEDEILARVAAGMKKYGVSLQPSIVPGTLSVTPVSYTKTKNTKSGDQLKEEINETLVHAELTFTWVNCDDVNDTLVVPWALVGQQGDASQAFGSGLTYANRYYMLKFFQIATPDDDPDNWRSKKEEAEQEAEMAIVRPIITKIDDHVKAYLNANENEASARKALIEVVKKYVKDGNKPTADYMNYLTDPTVAGELLEELDFLDASIYHLDGPDALKHLDRLLAIDKLKGIQWVYGAGQPTASHWIPVLKKIQDAGKMIQIDVVPEELDIMLENLKPEGVMYTINARTEEEGRALMKKVERYKR